PRPPPLPLFPYTTLFRSDLIAAPLHLELPELPFDRGRGVPVRAQGDGRFVGARPLIVAPAQAADVPEPLEDAKSGRRIGRRVLLGDLEVTLGHVQREAGARALGGG